MNNPIQQLSELINKRDYEKAIKLGGKFLFDCKLSDGDKSKVNIMLGWSYDQRALICKPKDRLNFQNEAIKCFKLSINADRFTSLRGMATVYHHQYQLSKALNYYRKALIINSKNSIIYNDIGNVYKRLFEISKRKDVKNKFLKLAEQNYLKSTKLASRNLNEKISPLINLVLFYKGVEDVKKAKYWSLRILEIVKKRKLNLALNPWLKMIKSVLDS